MKPLVSTGLLHDERQDLVKGKSSYVAILSLFAAYLAVLMYYLIDRAVVPWSTQLLFVVVIGVFATLTLRDDGAHFHIPGVPETRITLRQSTALHSLPWMIFFIGWFVGPITLVGSVIGSMHGNMPGEHAVFTSTGAAFGIPMLLAARLVISYFVARWIKEGRVVFMVASVLLVGFEVTFIAHLPTLASERAMVLNLAPLHLITYAWIIYVLLRYWKQIVVDGAIYQKDLAIDGKSDGFSWLRKVGPGALFIGGITLLAASLITQGLIRSYGGASFLATTPAGLLFLAGLTCMLLSLISAVIRRLVRI
jgi:hypothetical protein